MKLNIQLFASASVQSNTKDGRYLKLVVEETGYDISTNQSTVKWTFSSNGGKSTYYTIYNYGVYVNGSQVYDGTSGDKTKNWSTYKFPAKKGSVDGTLTIAHDSDGTKTISFSLHGKVQVSGTETHNGSLTLTPLPQPPSITSVSVNVNTVGSAIVTPTISGSYTNVEYSKDNSNWQSSSTLSVSHNTQYTFYVRANYVNDAGTSAWGTGSAVATTSGNAPTASYNASGTTISRTSAQIGFSYSCDTNAQYGSSSFQYGTNGSYDKTASADAYNHFIVNNLTPNTTYNYKFTVTDSPWSRTSNQVTGSFTTTGNAPSISGVSTDVYRTQCVLTPSVSYDTNASFNSVTIQYGTTTGYGLTSTSYTLTDLSPKTKYYYSLTVKDNWNRTATATGDFTTTAYLPYNLSITSSTITPFTAAISVSGTGDTNASITNYSYYYTVKPAINTYDMPIKYFQGARWARIFYHNNKKGTVLFTSLAECKNIQTEDRYSRLGLLDSGDTYKINGKYEFLLEYPIDAPGQYNRWKQTNAPQNEFITQSSSGGQVTGYEAVHIDWTNNYWGGLERNSSSTTSYNPTWLDGSCGHGNWFYAIGSNATFQRGIPSYGSTADVVELWIRIPDATVTSSSMGLYTTATVTGLNEETTYLLCMSATNAMGTNYSPTIEITTPADQAKLYIKLSGSWEKGKLYCKSNNTWVKVKKIYRKVNGQWVQNKN